MSGYFNQGSVTNEVSTADVTCFGATGSARSHVTGLVAGTISLTGFYDPAVGCSDVVIQADIASASNRVITFGWNGSTNWNKLEGSTAVATQGAFGLTVRSGFPRPLTTASTSALAGSTALSVCASNATLRSKVYAYSITTTNQTATQLGFYAGSTLVWAVRLQALSSAVSGANLAVTPPGYLFENSTGQAITLNTNGSTEAGWTVSAAYFQATD